MFVFPTGILTQIVTDSVLQPFGRTFIPAAYVKYIESGGSRVMPIRSDTECSFKDSTFVTVTGYLDDINL